MFKFENKRNRNNNRKLSRKTASNIEHKTRLNWNEYLEDRRLLALSPNYLALINGASNAMSLGAAIAGSTKVNKNIAIVSTVRLMA